jgi:heme exporter protein D
MITEFITMNGYGLYIWLSFSIVFISCAIVYYKTKKTLKKYEKEFLAELESLSIEEKNKALKNSKVAQQILATSTKIN